MRKGDSATRDHEREPEKRSFGKCFACLIISFYISNMNLNLGSVFYVMLEWKAPAKPQIRHVSVYHSRFSLASNIWNWI